MPVIVEITKTKKQFILLGTGFGMYHLSKPDMFWGNWRREERSGKRRLLCVCNEQGKVEWLLSDKVTVVSIDGKPPHHYL